ncbi:MAG: bifunctional chorismate-binding protein/class IV aminotransferase [Limnobacter sp.]|nr:bifunctional chorismate-binding protein/class IV aminotransferase [Limnobacter sp.]
MLTQSVFAAWCEGQHGAAQSLHNLNVAVGQPVWCKTSNCLAAIPALLDEAHQQSCAGLVVLACVPYEAAPAFDSALHIVQPVPEGGHAAATAMAFQPEQVLSWTELNQRCNNAFDPTSLDPASALDWTPWLNEHSQSWFDASFDQVREWIASGDFYQINLTTRLRATANMKGQDTEAANLALFKLFLTLFAAQPAAFSMFLRLPEGPIDGLTEQTILSLSPELFFTWESGQGGQGGQGRIVTSPMKGTRKPNDQSPRLADSSKDRAENLMIVDLLRNDLARVCLPRTVQAESLFDVMTLPSVEQMTSTISGLTRPGIIVSDLFRALFPCGSVTGAPKAQSMKRIAELETTPRGIYCGALGLFRPDGSMRFSVPIRTLVATHSSNSETRKLNFEYGVGSGLTWYSNKQDEHKEWWQKTVFLRDKTVDFDILETVRLENHEWQNMELHLKRMKNSAAHFSYVWNETHIRAKLQQLAGVALPESNSDPLLKGVSAEKSTVDPAKLAYRGRWLLSAEGNFEVQLFPLDAPPSGKVRLVLADRPMGPAHELEDFNTFIQHKTTYRPHYDAFAPQIDAQNQAAFDTLLYNEEGYLTETCRFNLVLKMGAVYLTPRISEENGVNNGVNLLNGVLRQRLLSENRIKEYPLHIGDLAQADEVWLINSLRGWVRVDEIVSQSFNQKGAVIFPQRHS